MPSRAGLFQEFQGGFDDVVFAGEYAFGLFDHDVGLYTDADELGAIGELLMSRAYAAIVSPAQVDAYRVAGAASGRRFHHLASACVLEQYGEVFGGRECGAPLTKSTIGFSYMGKPA